MLKSMIEVRFFTGTNGLGKKVIFSSSLILPHLLSGLPLPLTLATPMQNTAMIDAVNLCVSCCKPDPLDGYDDGENEGRTGG